MRQRCPATATRVRSGDRVRAVAAQVGVLAGGVVAADQQMMPPGVGVVFGAERDPGPGVQRVGHDCRRRRSVSARPVLGSSAGSRSTRIGPAAVGTRRLAATAST